MIRCCGCFLPYKKTSCSLTTNTRQYMFMLRDDELNDDLQIEQVAG